MEAASVAPLLSIHQASNGLELVARQSRCRRRQSIPALVQSLKSAIERLRKHGIAMIDGPSRRDTADGYAALSIYFRAPDGNLRANGSR